MTGTLIAEVQEFLSGLKHEFPKIFPLRRPVVADVPPQREKALEVLSARVAHWGAFMGVRPQRIRVKDQKSLWGSCSRQGTLNFNWRLILTPPAVLDYVVIHELAHLLEMNHSRRFWGHVTAWCPDHKAHRRWLRENAETILRPRR